MQYCRGFESLAFSSGSFNTANVALALHMKTAVMELHPVALRYKQPDEDGTKPLYVGPGCGIAHLPDMLLNELRKQHRTIEQFEREISDLRSRFVSNL
jgi:hypothetical protein